MTIAQKNYLCLLILLLTRSVVGDARIIVQLKNLPKPLLAELANDVKQDDNLAQALVKSETPGELTTSQIKNGLSQYLCPTLSGFPAVYYGYSTASGRDGEISFPLRHSKEVVYVAIVPEPKLIGRDQTVSHEEFYDNNPTLYQFEKLTDDNSIPYWKVSKVDKPDQNRVSLGTVIIFSNPANILIKTGDFKTEKSGHMVLPPLYVVGNEGMAEITSKMLKLKNFYEPITQKEKKASETAVVTVIDNF